MNLDKLTYGEIKDLMALFGSGKADGHPYTVGETRLFRLVTYHIVGVISEVHEREIVLDRASWVADSGRFGQAIAEGGALKELEFVGDNYVIGRGAIVDAPIFRGSLPTESV